MNGYSPSIVEISCAFILFYSLPLLPEKGTILNFIFIMLLLFFMVLFHLFNILISLKAYEININDILHIICILLSSFYIIFYDISMRIAKGHLFLLLNSLT